MKKNTSLANLSFVFPLQGGITTHNAGHTVAFIIAVQVVSWYRPHFEAEAPVHVHGSRWQAFLPPLLPHSHKQPHNSGAKTIHGSRIDPAVSAQSW